MSDSLNVLITGTNSGFGNLMVRTVAKAGHRAIAAMRAVEGRNEPAAAELRAFAESEGVTIDVVELDVTDDASVASAVEAAGRIDVLVNNAGITSAGITEAFTIDQHRQIFEVNYFGVLRVDRAVLPGMRARGSGQIVHISSELGRLPFPFMGSYCPSKFALEAYADQMAAELAAFNIKVTVIEPGAYPTGILSKSQTPADSACIESYGEVAKVPEQMFGGMVEMLSSEQAPDPQQVADVLLDLLTKPAADRPARIAVDPLAGKVIDSFNESAIKHAQDMIKAYGMD